MLGLCIVGTGVAGEIAARALQGETGGRLLAVVGSNPDKARAFAEKWNVPRWYAGLDEALADPDLLVMHICTPPFLKASHTLQCARAGRHVMVEKPIARNVAEADEMIAACEAAGVKLGCVFQHRFMPLPMKIKAAMEEGRLGRVFLGDAYVKWYRSEEYYRSGGWRATRDKEGGGALINQAIHSIDLLQWLMGPAVEVIGRTATAFHQIETEDLGVAIVRFQSGALGVIEGTTAAYPGFSERIELHGDRGSVILNEGKEQVEWYLRDQEPVVEGSDAELGYARNPASVSAAGHTAQFWDFYAAIQENRRPALDGRGGRRALEIIEAIYRSNRTGQPIPLPL